MKIEFDLPTVEFVILSKVIDNICVPEFYWENVLVVPSIGDSVVNGEYPCEHYYKVVGRRHKKNDGRNTIICFIDSVSF